MRGPKRTGDFRSFALFSEEILGFELDRYERAQSSIDDARCESSRYVSAKHFRASSRAKACYRMPRWT